MLTHKGRGLFQHIHIYVFFFGGWGSYAAKIGSQVPTFLNGVDVQKRRQVTTQLHCITSQKATQFLHSVSVQIQILRGPGWLSRYSDSLRAGRSGNRNQVGARFSVSVQTCPGTYPATYKMGTGSFLGVKRPGRGVDHPPLSSAESKDIVELHLYRGSTVVKVLCYKSDGCWFDPSCCQWNFSVT